MKSCVLYFSRTGNTKMLAETISESIKAPLFDIAASSPAKFGDFDLLILGTPVNGFNAAPEVTSFIKKLPETSAKQSIIFCTYALLKGRTFKTLEEALIKKGYQTILCTSWKGGKLRKENCKNVIDEITRVMKERKIE